MNSPTVYAEELRWKKKAELEKRIDKDNEDAIKAEEHRARMDTERFALTLGKEQIRRPTQAT